MKPDPYADLGVPKDADAATIKQAYRRQAKQHHPDKAGQSKTNEFLAIQRAYDLLSDAERRQRYDRYGDTEEQDLDVEAHKTLIGIVKEMATAIKNPKHENPLTLSASYIRKCHLEGEAKIGAAQKRIRRWQVIIKRTTTTAKNADNFLTAAFNLQIADETASIKDIELSIEIGRRMLKLLENFEYLVDPEPEFSTPFMPKSLFETLTFPITFPK